MSAISARVGKIVDVLDYSSAKTASERLFSQTLVVSPTTFSFISLEIWETQLQSKSWKSLSKPPTVRRPWSPRNVDGLVVTEDEIIRLYTRFRKLDRDGSGSIDRDEFLSIPQIAHNPLAQRLISIFDEDGGGEVDFAEFIKGLSAFSANSNKLDKLRCNLYRLYSRINVSPMGRCVQGV